MMTSSRLDFLIERFHYYEQCAYCKEYVEKDNTYRHYMNSCQNVTKIPPPVKFQALFHKISKLEKDMEELRDE